MGENTHKGKIEADLLLKWRGDRSLRVAARVLGVSHQALVAAERGSTRFGDDRLRQWATSRKPHARALGVQLWIERNRKVLRLLSVW